MRPKEGKLKVSKQNDGMMRPKEGNLKFSKSNNCMMRPKKGKWWCPKRETWSLVNQTIAWWGPKRENDGAQRGKVEVYSKPSNCQLHDEAQRGKLDGYNIWHSIAWWGPNRECSSQMTHKKISPWLLLLRVLAMGSCIILPMSHPSADGRTFQCQQEALSRQAHCMYA